MTDENETNDNETDESLDESAVKDVDAALESTGAVDPETDESDESEDSESQGLLNRLTELSGTGDSLDSYESDPIASVVDPNPDGEGTHKGAKHIARGVDGLSPVAATNPLIDIAVGFVLISADSKSDGGVFGSDGDGADPNDSEVNDDRGEMLT